MQYRWHSWRSKTRAFLRLGTNPWPDSFKTTTHQCTKIRKKPSRFFRTRKSSETEARAKLELPGKSPIFYRGNLPGVAGRAIYTVVALGGIKAQDRVIEDVEPYHPELKIHSLSYLDILQQGKVSCKGARPVEGITPHVAELAHTGATESAAGRAIRGEGAHRCKEEQSTGRAGHTSGEAAIAIRTAWTGIAVG